MISNDVATSFLKASKWNVEAALNEYFSNPQKFSGPDANFVQNLTQVYEQYKGILILYIKNLWY
jgi:hypothetical protein